MGNQLKHPAGNFCWFELGTTDAAAAKDFYGKVFGWQSHDIPLPGDMGVYTMLLVGDKEVAALYQLGPQQAGVPSHWMPYVAVESADDAIAKATELGGEVVMPAFDVMEVGRMAIFKDPTGATLSVWQPKEHFGADLVRDPGSVCWVELATPDTAAAKTFYTSLFGWSFKDSQSEVMAYTEWINGAQPIGGMLAQDGPQWEGVPPHWLTYFTVADADATAAQAQEMGGKVIVPPTDIPGTGRFTVLMDPQGAPFAVIKMTMPM
jgi:predicted enzyme related to lactoylglutathione lyase